MNLDKRLKGLSLKVGPLGESDRLLTILSDKEGVIRLAIPGARKPKSSLAAAAPLTFLDLHIVGRRGLPRVKQMKIIRSFSNLGKQIETLAAAQALTELILLLVANNDPQPSLLKTVLIHLERLEEIANKPKNQILVLAKVIQACIHLLALGGYCIPLQTCSRSGMILEPPLGQWEWRCSLIPEEGFVIGSIPNAIIQLNPSELALLQRLLQPNLPVKKNLELMGPIEAWLKLLTVIECWIEHHLPKNLRSLQMLREVIIIPNLSSDGLNNLDIHYGTATNTKDLSTNN
tara:strand:- start:860 stop:1726 length:867 start_codon:yes stop_codon:yes gene_type:complete